jgi:chorismate synthase
MASNSFGKIFKITTWGESHGKAIGVVIDGCPANLDLSEKDINDELKNRWPKNCPFISQRKEIDEAQILSGIFEGKTTGAPISIIIYNKHIDSKRYDDIKDILRPSHGNYTYLEKYNIFDHRGGGRASGRDTANIVAAGAIAKKLLAKLFNFKIAAFLKSVGSICLDTDFSNFDLDSLKENVLSSSIYCPDKNIEKQINDYLSNIQNDHDSTGGMVEVIATPPSGLGDPVFEKINANLAKAFLSIPGCKAFEIGQGVNASKMRGSDYNDLFISKDDQIKTKTNNSGGVLAGITTGMPLICRAYFKPTPTIAKDQKSLTINKQEKILHYQKTKLHDICIAIRAVRVAEAMCSLVLADSALSNRLSKL